MDALNARLTALQGVPAVAATPERRPRSVIHRRIALAPWDLEDREARLKRRQRWLAAAMAKAYDMAWVPESVVANISRIEVDQDRGAVILVLRSGTRLVDRQDRIDIVGTVDDVSVDELVEAVRRRGWDAVEVEGSDAFRLAVARRLAALEPPVVVANSPLDESDSPGLLPGSFAGQKPHALPQLEPPPA